MTIPKQHNLSFSTIQEPEKSLELEAIIETVSKITGKDKFALFEHGSNAVGGIQKPCGNSVYHAHMHFIPDIEMSEPDILKYIMSGTGEQEFRLKDSEKFTNCISFNAGNAKKLTLDFMKVDLPTKEHICFVLFREKMAVFYAYLMEKYMGIKLHLNFLDEFLPKFAILI